MMITKNHNNNNNNNNNNNKAQTGINLGSTGRVKMLINLLTITLIDIMNL